MTARTYYLRSAKKNQDGRGDPIACLMSEVDREASAIRYSIAAAHKQDEFSKSIGRKIAAGRLEMSPRVLTGINIPTSGHQIGRLIMNDIIQQVDILTTISKVDIEVHFANKWFYHIPAKVGAAAKRWMKKANEPKTWKVSQRQLDLAGIQGVSIPTIQVQSHNASPPTTPDLPTNKDTTNRTQKPWGDGEYPSSKINADVETIKAHASTNKLSNIQQNYDYFQTQLPSLLKNTFVKGRFVVVAEMDIQRAFDKFADAHNYAVGQWDQTEFVVQKVIENEVAFFGGGMMRSLSPKTDEFLGQMRSAAEEQERIAKNMPQHGVRR